MTNVSETDPMATADPLPETLTRSPSETPRTSQSVSCMRTVGSEVSRS